MIILLNLLLVTSLALLLAKTAERAKLPRLLGMMLAGVIVGKYAQSVLSHKLPAVVAETVFLSSSVFQPLQQDPFLDLNLFSLSWSAMLKKLALIVILIRACLGIDRKTLTHIGQPALRLGLIPGILEACLVAYASSMLFQVSPVEAFIFGWVIAAVSPAVIVPQMLTLKEMGYGRVRKVPTLILASAAVDNVVAITLFDSCLDFNTAAPQHLVMAILSIPIRIGLGVAVGYAIGYALSLIFPRFKGNLGRAAIFLLATIALHLVELELAWPVASLIGIMAIGFAVLAQDPNSARQLARIFNQIWKVAEVALFVLIGAEVDLSLVAEAGLVGMVIIGLGLLGRSLGVLISLAGTELNWREKFFCQISYLPKATVQAAIGGIALTMVKSGDLQLTNGVETGQLILAIAVLSIVIAAPLGAISIKLTAPRLLKSDEDLY